MNHRLQKRRVSTGAGQTTVYLALFPRGSWRLHLEIIDEDLVLWSKKYGISYALTASFYVDQNILHQGEKRGDPLGQLWISGEDRTVVPFDEPWNSRRAALLIEEDDLQIDAFSNLSPGGDIIQAGPKLLSSGNPARIEEEGFALDSLRFNSDITKARHPRSAIAFSKDWILLLATDGRAEDESGMLLQELSRFLQGLGMREALNLDGGQSIALIYDGQLQNRPRGEDGKDHVPGSRFSPTALFLLPKKKE